MEERCRKQNRLVGIELLRILMVLCVIVHHINSEYSIVTRKLAELDVYVFAAIAFFFIDSTLENINTKYVQRIMRLIIPMWSWSIFYYVVYGIRGGYDIRSLFFQLLTGVSEYNPTLWFLANQIFLLTIFCILKQIIKKNGAYWMIMAVLSIMCILTHSRVQFIYDDFYLRNTIGRILAIFPVVIIGKIAKIIWLRLQQYENLATESVLLILEIIAFAGIFIFTEINEIEKLAISFLLLMIFNSKLWALLNIKNIFIRGVLNISRYTLGVYCVHVIIISFLRKMGIHSMCPYMQAIVVYAISIMICIAISRVAKLRILVE